MKCPDCEKEFPEDELIEVENFQRGIGYHKRVCEKCRRNYPIS